MTEQIKELPDILPLSLHMMMACDKGQTKLQKLLQLKITT
jgi:hypothetical protein